MQRLGISAAQGPLRVLCLGAHADDIEIGAGGSLLALLEANGSVHVDWVVLTSDSQRGSEAKQAASLFLAGASSTNIETLKFEDGFLPSRHADVKREFEALKARTSPDVIFTHYSQDAHQDHRLVNELTWNTFRDHLILEYEIPKYDGDLGKPGTYVPVTRQQLDAKIAILMKVYQTQRNKDWFEPETFRALARLRGMECRSASGYAEAFYCRKTVLGFG